MKNRKILFHINSLGKGGAERVLTVLAGYFAQDGYRVSIVTLWRAENEYEVPAGVKRVNLGDEKVSGGRLALAVRRFTGLRGLIKKENPDIVISFCMKANFRSVFSMLGMRIPLLVSVRSDPQIDYAPHKFLTKWMERKAAGCVFQTKDAQAFFGERLRKKSRIIWNPIDEKYLPENRESAKGALAGGGADRQERGGGAGDICIITVGRITFEKNQLMLLKAFDRIKDKFPSARVRVYGEGIGGDAWKEMDAYIRQNGIAHRVEFMGPSSSLEKEIVNAALFVLPSNYEGMSNALMEAMVMGLPVIATDCPCGGCATLIKEGISGFLVPTGDDVALAEAMERVLSDKKLAEKLSENAGRLSEKVKPLKIYEEWRSYAEELAGN
ncbi:MAG: glycosyltransferase family 4 protein [Lachnospiraceae bacterium]|jgi:glycosyltransferase involved in cell wall biosynthesis|nr:glycosyltransferase family 4 protein [Lachnospiraceae bacterium]